MDSEYDFFATGRPAPDPASEATPAPPPAPAVNQFGTPLDVVGAPVGPAAAPGYGPSQRPAPPFGAPVLSAPRPLAPPGARVLDPAARPGMVLAAGIIALVQAGFALLGVVGGMLAITVLNSQLAASGLEVSGGFTGIIVIILLVVAAIAAVYLVAGIGAIRGHRPLVWTLLTVESLALLLGLLQLANADLRVTGGDGGGLAGLVDLAVPIAVIILLLVPRSLTWLRRG
ncbi:MAG TPA: hypothetical protein VFN19_10485 [Candidatus Nanopelagicales bacterium]|nr:hypothetical protein [Candidatus Nanopelagicales bacterium]